MINDDAPEYRPRPDNPNAPHGTITPVQRCNHLGIPLCPSCALELGHDGPCAPKAHSGYSTDVYGKTEILRPCPCCGGTKLRPSEYGGLEACRVCAPPEATTDVELSNGPFPILRNHDPDTPTAFSVDELCRYFGVPLDALRLERTAPDDPLFVPRDYSKPAPGSQVDPSMALPHRRSESAALLQDAIDHARRMIEREERAAVRGAILKVLREVTIKDDEKGVVDRLEDEILAALRKQ